MGSGVSSTGGNSVAMGNGTSATGPYSTAVGWNSTASGQGSFASGAVTNAANYNSAAFGALTTAGGFSSFTAGFSVAAPSFAEMEIGLYATTYTASSAGSYVAADRLFNIGNGQSTSSRSDAMTVLKNGNVGIGTNAPTDLLSVNGAANNTTGAWAVFSDRRVKNVTGDFTDGLNVIKQIHTIRYRYNDDAPFHADGEQIGIIAQELEQIAPYMVTQKQYGSYKDMREVNNQAYVFLLINGMKEQQHMIETQQGQMQKQQSQIDELRNEIELLKKK